MRLFHGSIQEVQHPDPAQSRKNLDFGLGFYLTSYQKQAERWALRKAYLESAKAIVNEYECPEDLGAFNVLRFDEADKDWVEFVCSCRRGDMSYRHYDVIVGSVANDKVYEAVNMYYTG